MLYRAVLACYYLNHYQCQAAARRPPPGGLGSDRPRSAGHPRDRDWPWSHPGRGPTTTAGRCGRIEIRPDRTVLGDIGPSGCVVERRAVLEHIRVDEPYRRHEFGRVLVAAALSGAPGLAWASIEITSEHARAFRATVAPPITLGEPRWCSHILVTAGNHS